jgi:hypothetical protein
MSGVLILALLFASESPALARWDVGSTRSIVGTYRVVTHDIGGIGAGMTFRARFRIKRFNKATGSFTGTGTQTDPGPYPLTITGTVKRSKIVMHVRDKALGYTATDHGRIERNGNIKGTLTDSEGNTGRWTMTRL